MLLYTEQYVNIMMQERKIKYDSQNKEASRSSHFNVILHRIYIFIAMMNPRWAPAWLA